ncbi:MAG: hypothetical protein JWN30_151 [Bacilli bacterium]|nr:hypothetical protein [Bacilli bacterium]
MAAATVTKGKIEIGFEDFPDFGPARRSVDDEPTLTVQ